MDRPSSRPLAAPDYVPRQAPEGFVLPPVPDTTPEVRGGDRVLFVERIVVDGNTVFPEPDIRSLTRSYEGRDVTVAELEELRQKITRQYIDRGYVNSGAVIAPDAFRDGELHIRIVEGRIDEIRVKGLGWLREGYVQNRLVRDPDKPFNLQDMQERFQLLLSDPLVERMNGRILPGASPGRAILDVDVTRARPYRLSLFGNNQRPPSIGGEAFGVSGLVHNLTGLGDALDFTFITSDGSNRYAGGFNLPVTDWGTQAYFRFDEGDSLVIEKPIREIDITSEVHSLEGGITQPVIDTLRRRLSLGVALTVRENETFLLGRPFSFVPGETTGRNQATVWRLFQDFVERWDNHALVLRSTFSVGMNALGATPERAVPPAFRSVNNEFPDSEFFSWLGQAQYAWRIRDDGTQLVLRGNAQFSDEPLLPLERIAVGGRYTVRGYRENYLVRDQGYSLSTEFRYPILGGGEANALHRATLIPFMDYGEAWNHGGEESVALFSVGIGFEWQLKPLSAEFYWGYPLNKPKPEQKGDVQDDGIHFLVRLDVF